MSKSLQSHRCAVCWERQGNHADWYEHGVQIHGAALKPFDYDVCEHDYSHGCRSGCREHTMNCPGIQHDKRMPNYGSITRRPRLEPTPFTDRDGTVYTPVPLFDEAQEA